MKQESYLVKDMLTPGEMMNLVGRMTVIIGMRLHALIMAAAQGIPFAAISYDPKVDRFTERMGQAVACPVENLSCLHLKTVVEQILENYSLIKEKLLCEAKILSLKARENAQYAHKVLEGVEGNIYD